MANEEHLEILKQGVEVWNKWRQEIRTDLRDADLSDADLSGVKLKGVDLSSVDLSGANLSRADLAHANLNDADLSKANLSKAILIGADLTIAILFSADLSGALLLHATLNNTNLRLADLTGATLCGANLNDAKLEKSKLERTIIGSTSLADIDLSSTIGLENVRHISPSSIGIDTLYRSGGKIPVEFLRGCGVPEDLITFIPSLVGAREAIQFSSCFISYSTKDEEFARRLYSRMRDEKLRVWFAPEDMKGGKLLHEQIEQAIQIHDRLLVVLSEESMASEWVKREISNAMQAEERENRRKLFPIGLTSFERIKEWNSSTPIPARTLHSNCARTTFPIFQIGKTTMCLRRSLRNCCAT